MENGKVRNILWNQDWGSRAAGGRRNEGSSVLCPVQGSAIVRQHGAAPIPGEWERLVEYFICINGGKSKT